MSNEIDNVRLVEDRRYIALQAVRCSVEVLRETNPAVVFGQAGSKDAALDTAKAQAINNRWADQAADIITNALKLADAISADALDLFQGEPSRPSSSGV